MTCLIQTGGERFTILKDSTRIHIAEEMYEGSVSLSLIDLENRISNYYDVMVVTTDQTNLRIYKSKTIQTISDPPITGRFFVSITGSLLVDQ